MDALSDDKADFCNIGGFFCVLEFVACVFVVTQDGDEGGSEEAFGMAMVMSPYTHTQWSL